MADEGISTGTGPETPTQDGGQVEGAATESMVNPDGGQGKGKAPAQDAGQADGSAPDGGKPAGKAKADNSEAPAWDGETQKWLSSKGYDIAAYDPANESHSKLIKQMREMEAAETRKRQAEKAQETLKRAQTAKSETHDAKPEKGPIDNYKEDFGRRVSEAIRLNGCRSAEELEQRNPGVYWQLENEYPVKLAELAVEQVRWEMAQEHKKSEKDAEQKRFHEDFNEAKRLYKETLDKFRAKYPNLDQNFKRHGVTAFFDRLEKKYAIYPEMLGLDEEMIGFLAEAADAIAYRHAEPDRKKDWQQQYEKEKLELAKAQGPRPSGTSSKISGAPPSGGNSIDDILSRHSRPFKL